MKFIADVMLGRLAKWMRLLGFDVLYDAGLDDNQIIHLSLTQDRVILTRDTQLAARPLASKAIFIKSEKLREQLNQVLETYNIQSAPAPLTRCSVCNHPLLPVAKESVRNLVPEYVYQQHDHFFKCNQCGKVYWRGTHVKRMAYRKQV